MIFHCCIDHVILLWGFNFFYYISMLCHSFLNRRGDVQSSTEIALNHGAAGGLSQLNMNLLLL